MLKADLDAREGLSNSDWYWTVTSSNMDCKTETQRALKAKETAPSPVAS